MEIWKQIWRNIANELRCDELPVFRNAIADDVARQELLLGVDRSLAVRIALTSQIAGELLGRLTVQRGGQCPQ
ncbi:MAG TPA: hypothetical protein VL371_25705 [Gemmataceae bacterium]|nr:hypothetical protein [Gemmataceae bacterium]